jgi:hypothetical protein
VIRFFCTGIASQEEETMKITNLIVALLAAGTVAVFGQEGTVQDIKHDAKKAGEKIKEGVETVGEKTKETAETVGRKTKETVEGSGEKTTGTARATHRKSRRTSNSIKTQGSEQQSTNQQPTPSPVPGGR